MYRETESFFKKSHAAISDTYSLNSYILTPQPFSLFSPAI